MGAMSDSLRVRKRTDSEQSAANLKIEILSDSKAGGRDSNPKRDEDHKTPTDRRKSAPEKKRPKSSKCSKKDKRRSSKRKSPRKPKKKRKKNVSIGSVPDSWCPDIPRNSKNKLSRLRSDSYPL